MEHLDHPSPHFSDAKMARFLLHHWFWGTGDNCSIFVQDCSYLIQADVKPWPNDRSMPTQHVATLLVAACCVRLATVLPCVATCWVLLAQI